MAHGHRRLDAPTNMQACAFTASSLPEDYFPPIPPSCCNREREAALHRHERERHARASPCLWRMLRNPPYIKTPRRTQRRSLLPDNPSLRRSGQTSGGRVGVRSEQSMSPGPTLLRRGVGAPRVGAPLWLCTAIPHMERHLCQCQCQVRRSFSVWSKRFPLAIGRTRAECVACVC